jgi:hypothetical protein
VCNQSPRNQNFAGTQALTARHVGPADAVFYLHSGATLKNVIIGKNQAEGVHCDGPCTLQFVWFEDVCEDAITIVSSPSSGNIIQARSWLC